MADELLALFCEKLLNAMQWSGSYWSSVEYFMHPKTLNYPNFLKAFKISPDHQWFILFARTLSNQDPFSHSSQCDLWTLEMPRQLSRASSFCQSDPTPRCSAGSVFGNQSTESFMRLAIASSKHTFCAQISAHYLFWKWGVTSNFHMQSL